MNFLTADLTDLILETLDSSLIKSCAAFRFVLDCPPGILLNFLTPGFAFSDILGVI